MAKPIFIVKYPRRVTPKELENIMIHSRDYMPDYYILFVPIENDEFQFECYNSDEANDIDFKLLQERVIKLTKMAVRN